MLSIEKKDILFVAAVTILLLIGTVLNFSAVGYILTAAAGIYALLQPKKGLILLFIYLPVRPFIIEFNPALRAIADAVVIAAFFRIVWDQRKDIKSMFSFQLFEYGYFGFIIVGAVSALLTGVSTGAIIFQVRAFILFYLVYYIVKRLDIKKEDVKLVIWSSVTVFLILIIQAVTEKLSVRGAFLPASWEAMPLSAKNRIRIYGMLGNPNVFSIYMSFAFVLFIFLKNRSQGSVKWLFAALSVLSMGMIVLTYSRGTWIGFAIAILLYVVMTKRLRILIESVKYLAIAALICILPLNLLTNYIESTESGQQKVGNIQQFDEGGESGFSDRLGSTFSDDTITGSQNSGRLYIVQKGLEIFMDNPVIGTGFSTYGDSATISRGSPIYEEYDVRPKFYSDNQYIQIIVQTGAAGVVMFAIFLIGAFYELFKRRKESKYYVYMAGILLGGYFMGLVYNLWENDIFTFIFFATLGVALNLKDSLKKNLRHQFS